MVDWARENASLNHLEKAPIRWIVDDAIKFLKREIKRKSFYDGIILDPPTFGRGNKGEVFKIERDLLVLMDLCKDLLSEKRQFLILSCHTPLISPIVLHNVMEQILEKDHLKTGEMVLNTAGGFSIPSGCYAIKTYG
jgi:23S rRNA (cytosine1962-C5)-methyltransferase